MGAFLATAPLYILGLIIKIITYPYAAAAYGFFIDLAALPYNLSLLLE
jgi:hypothetical protein